MERTFLICIGLAKEDVDSELEGEGDAGHDVEWIWDLYLRSMHA